MYIKQSVPHCIVTKTQDNHTHTTTKRSSAQRELVVLYHIYISNQYKKNVRLIISLRTQYSASTQFREQSLSTLNSVSTHLTRGRRLKYIYHQPFSQINIMPFVDSQRTSCQLRCPYSIATSILNTNAQSSPHSCNMSTHHQSVRCPSIAKEPTPFNIPQAFTCLVVADSGIYTISLSQKPICHSWTLREPVINGDFLTHQQPVS